MLLFAIEGRTARLVDRSRRAMAPGVTERSAVERERAFLQALAEGGDLPIQPTIQDLERYARAWAPLVSPDPARRAAVIHAMGERYTFTARVVPALRQALGLDGSSARDRLRRPAALARATPLAASRRVATAREPAARLDRVRVDAHGDRWRRHARAADALAGWGPALAVVLLVVFGVVNVLTIAAIVEAITRDGAIRYGSAYFGRLVRTYLGDAATAVLTPELLIFLLVVLVAFYIGVATTMADVTAVPATAWAAGLFIVGVVILRRENLNATVASALLVGVVNIALILALALLALPSRGGCPPALCEPAARRGIVRRVRPHLVFGVLLAAYFGHTSAGNAAKVVFRRDPSGRALMVETGSARRRRRCPLLSLGRDPLDGTGLGAYVLGRLQPGS